jgi:hypothetical protein
MRICKANSFNFFFFQGNGIGTVIGAYIFGGYLVDELNYNDACFLYVTVLGGITILYGFFSLICSDKRHRNKVTFSGGEKSFSKNDHEDNSSAFLEKRLRTPSYVGVSSIRGEQISVNNEM